MTEALDRITPSSRCFHSCTRDVPGTGTVRRDHYLSVLIQHPNSEYRWKVHVGDVIAYSTEHNDSKWVTRQDLDEWQPNHLKKASPHWKIGLVVNLAQVVELDKPNGGNQASFECDVEDLEKFLDHPSTMKKVESFFRPYTRRPHVLMRTFSFSKIHPANILPVRITMLTNKEFEWGFEWDERDKFVFQLHCPYKLVVNNGKVVHQPDGDKDKWPDVNHVALASRKKSKGSAPSAVRVPSPLQNAWLQWDTTQEDERLLPALTSHYPLTKESKVTEFLSYINRREKKRQLEKEEEEAEEARRAQKRAKRSRAPDDASHRRVRIHEGPSSKSKGAAVSSRNKRGIVKSIMRKVKETVSKKTGKKAAAADAPTLSTQSTSSITTEEDRHPKKKQPPTKKAKKSPPTAISKLVLSKAQKSLIIEAKDAWAPHVGTYRGEKCDFYERIQVRPKQTKAEYNSNPAKIRSLLVGQVVAVTKPKPKPKAQRAGDDDETWRIGQIVSLYQVACDEGWNMHLRLFLRPEEIPQGIYDKLRGFDMDQGLLETMQLESLPVQALLYNTTVEITSAPKKQAIAKNHYNVNARKNCLWFRCRHLLKQDGKNIATKTDWTDFSETGPVTKGPLKRALECKGLHRKVFDKYRDAIEKRSMDVDSEDAGSSQLELMETSSIEVIDDGHHEDSDADSQRAGMEEDENNDEQSDSPSGILVYPLHHKPIYQNWGKRFHDGVRMDVDKNSLQRGFEANTQQWILKVGYVVPIACELQNVPARHRKKKWYPYEATWAPAQIVSIFQNEKNEWKMQIRWFNRHEDLLEEHQQTFSHLAKDHVLFETEDFSVVDVGSCFPGRVSMTSSEQESWQIEKSGISGLPIIPRFCSHICVDDQIDESIDWSGYDLKLTTCPMPLVRGLLVDPRNRTNKGWILMLSRYYKKHIRMRGTDPDLSIFQAWFQNSRHISLSAETIFDPSEVQVQLGASLREEVRPDSEAISQFTNGFDVKVPLKHLVKAPKDASRSNLHSFSARVGDVVCYYSTTAGSKSDHAFMKNYKNPWHPFKVPFSLAQVLAVYQDRDGPMLEVRRFYRPSEVCKDHHFFMPPNSSKEEVFESDTVCRINAAYCLGRVEVFLGHHKKSGSSGGGFLSSCRCKFFYHTAHGRFQPLYTSGLSPQQWAIRLVERGLSLSQLRTEHSGLGEAIRRLSLPQSPVDVGRLLNKGRGTGHIVGDTMMPTAVSGNDQVDRTLYTKVQVEPSWSNMMLSSILFSEKDQDFKWEVQVGSIVVVRCRDGTGGRARYPFTCPWEAYKVVSLYTTASASSKDQQLMFEAVKMKEVSGNFGILQIVANEDAPVEEFEASFLLGPTVVLEQSPLLAIDWDQAPKTLPAPFYSGSGDARLIEKLLTRSKVYNDESVAYLRHKLGLSRVLAQEPHRVKSPKSTYDSRVKGDETQYGWTSSRPLHTDLSQLRLFYSDFTVRTTGAAIDDASKKQSNSDIEWKVKSGDVVLIHCDGPAKYPFKCNWGVAEIVAVFRQFETIEELDLGSHVGNAEKMGQLQVEIRWFYDRHDIKGVSGHDSAASSSNEILETDDVIRLKDVSSLLAPALLAADDDHSSEMVESFMNIPIQRFVCRRFWSSTRKSLIPTGNLAGRRKRAELYSTCLPKGIDIFNQETVNNVHPTIIPEKKEEWVDCMNDVIKRLNLKEASKGVYRHGTGLIGREKELSQLQSFFRAAIRGQPGTGGIRSSIFLAGPPGVGKTACIRASISKLQAEQLKGEIPSFDFIPLNGMEMRHPFESYVKLWEAITGRKHVGSHEKACQKLEAYFTNPSSAENTNSQQRRAIVVLLDEIDYLVTEKQSVLYNFFDWPKRAASVPNGRRLIVIGISNTLNLTEQLMPSVRSRVGSERIAFKAYNAKAAEAILRAKVSDVSTDFTLFEKEALVLAAKKTAALSGDIRKAFQICRAAAEMVLQRAKEQEAGSVALSVKIGDVQKASKKSFDAVLVTAVSFSTPFQALLLITLAALCRTTGREVGGFDIKDIATKMESIVGSSGDPQFMPSPSFVEILQLLGSLAENNLVTLQTARPGSNSFRFSTGGSGAWPMVSLSIDEHTLARGLKSTPYKKLVDKILPSLL